MSKMIKNRIKEYRARYNMKQEELAEYLGVSFQAVSKWETGASVPDIALLPDLAVFFGVTIDELFQMSYEAEFERMENMFWHERRIPAETFGHCVRFLERAVQSDPKNVRAYSCLAELYNHRAGSDHELAGEYAKKVLELDPEEKRGWVAYLEANNGVCGDEWYDNHFEVIEYFKEFLIKNPGNYRGLYAVIENMLDDERYDEAVPYIEQMRTAANTHQYDTYMGDVMFGKGNTEKALEYWNMMEQPMAFLDDKALWPLSLYLPEITWERAGFAFCASVITLIPAAFVFILGQDYLEQGIIYSGLKE